MAHIGAYFASDNAKYSNIDGVPKVQEIRTKGPAHAAAPTSLVDSGVNATGKQGKVAVPATIKQEIIAAARLTSDVVVARRYAHIPGVNAVNVGRWRRAFEADLPVTNRADIVERHLAYVTSDKRTENGRKLPVAVTSAVFAWFNAQRERGNAITTDLIRAAFWRVCGEEAPEILKTEKNKRGWFVASDEFLRSFRRAHNITTRAGTTDSQKFPQGMTESDVKRLWHMRIAHQVMLHNIDPSMVVHADETGIHLLPVPSYTYEIAGSKKVTIKGCDDKRQCTVMVAGAMDGRLLKPYVVFAGKTLQAVPKNCDKKLVQCSVSPNHWMSALNVKEWLQDVVVPHFQATREANNLLDDCAALLLWDVCAVHIDAGVRDFISANYPWIKVVYSIPGCTSVLNVADIALNKPLKAFLKQRIMDVLAKRDANHPVPSLPELKALLVEWLPQAYAHMTKNKMTEHGVRRSGMQAAWTQSMRDQAADRQRGGTLWNKVSPKDLGHTAAAHAIATAVRRLAPVGSKRQRDESRGRMTSADRPAAAARLCANPHSKRKGLYAFWSRKSSEPARFDEE